MLTNYNRWVFENKKSECVETLREWIIEEAEFYTVAAETLCGIAGRRREGVQTFFGQTGHQERQRYWNANIAEKIPSVALQRV